MGLVIATDPALEPVTLADLKEYLRITTNEQDTTLNALGKAARQQAEVFLRKVLITQTWTWTLDDFPPTPIWVPWPPLQSVTSITYQDVDDDTQTLAASNYVVSTGDTPGRITLSSTGSFPSTFGEADDVTITFVAGYGASPSDVPQPIRLAIQLMAGHWFEHRESVVMGGTPAEIPMGSESLLMGQRNMRYV